MIVDASAVLAILLDEPDGVAYSNAIITVPFARISAGNWLEVAIIVDRKHKKFLKPAADTIFEELNLTIEPVTGAQIRIAREAYRTYGKGSGHKAGLNFGDCFAYALAKAFGEPLLYKGDDFALTDIAAVPLS